MPRKAREGSGSLQNKKENAMLAFDSALAVFLARLVDLDTDCPEFDGYPSSCATAARHPPQWCSSDPCTSLRGDGYPPSLGPEKSSVRIGIGDSLGSGTTLTLGIIVKANGLGARDRGGARYGRHCGNCYQEAAKAAVV